MILSGEEIKKAISMGDIVIAPYSESRLNPNSYNLRLANELLVYEGDLIDMKKDNPTKKLIIPEDGLVLEPGKLYLGSTVEYTRTDRHVPMLEGRSSIGRVGLSIHVTAGFGDVGFAGFWTLELYCIQPVKIYPWIEICQIYYHDVSEDHKKYSSGKYQNNNGVQASMLYKEFIGAEGKEE